MKIALALLLGMMFLLGCSGSSTPNPIPTTDVGAIQTSAVVAILATQTASAPVATDTPQPSNTPAATNTSKPSNTPEATNTVLPTITPNPTDTPLPTLVPTRANTPVPRPTDPPPAEFVFQWKNPFYECQKVYKPWTLSDGSQVAGARSFQITVAIKNISTDKTLQPPWEPSVSVITNGQNTHSEKGFWEWGRRVKRGVVDLYDQPAVAPGVVAEWTFITFPVQQDEWVDHIEWELFGQTYRSDNFGPGEFHNNFNYKFCPQD